MVPLPLESGAALYVDETYVLQLATKNSAAELRTEGAVPMAGVAYKTDFTRFAVSASRSCCHGHFWTGHP